VRVTGIGPRLARDRRGAWERWYASVSTARWRSAIWHSLARALFGGAFVGGVVFVAKGIDVSLGQWQKLALARGFMRDGPLLLVLDEPTAALDAETEHALFERYSAGARRGAEDGRITILVSHRFSTVRMADLIVVLDGARAIEVGGHDELMASGGHYAELYGIQAAAYR